jgi:Mg2+ and Co2+ transporter CorA
MSRIQSAFGDSYQKASAHLRTKTFELGGHVFKVRIPLTKEMEQIEAAITTIDDQVLQQRYEKMSSSFRDGTLIDGVEITEDDVIVEGRSTKDLVRQVIMMEQRIVQFIRLLVAEVGTLDNLTYEDVDAEWPMAVQLEMIAKITEAIQPGYKDSRKN